MSYPMIKGHDFITLVIDGESVTLHNDHINYQSVLKAIREKDWDSVRDLVQPAKAITEYSRGLVTIQDGELKYAGEVLKGSLTTRIMDMLREGFDIEPMVKFLENLQKNPSKRSVDELDGFMTKGKLPITEDGCFLAYKRVRDDYLDCHSRSVLNQPAETMTAEQIQQYRGGVRCGKNQEVEVKVVHDAAGAFVTEVSMNRNKVDDDKDRTCSAGLHFCSVDYLSHFHGDRVVILKINPADVVSIPSDYEHTKGRCSKYQVIGEYKGDFRKDGLSNQSVATDEYCDEEGWEFNHRLWMNDYDYDDENEDYDDEQDYEY